MTERERQNFARTVALQALYYAGQQRHGRRLTSVEMAQAIRTVEGFMAEFFGTGLLEHDHGAMVVDVGNAATSAGEVRD